MRTTIIKVAQLVAIVLLGVYVSGCSARMSGGFHAGLPGTAYPEPRHLLPPSSELKPAKDFAPRPFNYNREGLAKLVQAVSK